jgi:hypothetical protein
MIFVVFVRALVAGAMCIAVVAGCGSGGDDASPPASSTTLAPSESPGPAAGSCAPAVGEFAAFTMAVDVPMPRCLQVRPDERLRLTNGFDHPIDVTIGGVTATLAPGETQTVGPRFASYLAPGVHVVHSAAYGGSGPELWLR